MLLAEGFRDEGYIDVFDGGPQVAAAIDTLATVRDSRVEPIASTGIAGTGATHLIAAATALGFRCTHVAVADPAACIAISRPPSLRPAVASRYSFLFVPLFVLFLFLFSASSIYFFVPFFFVFFFSLF